uniref:Putative tap42-like family n=1 Tax=Amblyomma aureolatum TaxID=187763 RepID=A0A1E1X2Y5_9ACAR
MGDSKCAEESNLSSLNELFDRGFKLFLEIEKSTDSANDKAYQNKVREATSQFEDATHLVNELGIFSENEEIDEVATSHLKFLLLPALLGSLTQKKVTTDRSEILRLSEVYFRDYLTRCRQYGVTSYEVPEAKDEDACDKKADAASPKKSEADSLVDACRKRKEKIARFTEQKAMEERQRQLKDLMDNPNVDDETLREYYNVLLKYWVNNSIEELRSIEEEKPILQYMVKMKAQGKPTHEVSTQQQPKKPLRPIIITRNEVQKRVYGVGYPSIPSMTVDEFYAKRYPEHAQQESSNSSAVKPWSLQDWATDPEKAARELEEEDAQKEELVEADDQAALDYKRAMDDWKDENRRGSGNRKKHGVKKINNVCV